MQITHSLKALCPKLSTVSSAISATFCISGVWRYPKFWNFYCIWFLSRRSVISFDRWHWWIQSTIRQMKIFLPLFVGKTRYELSFWYLQNVRLWWFPKLSFDFCCFNNLYLVCFIVSHQRSFSLKFALTYKTLNKVKNVIC